jgi:hypothetical protein
MCSRDDTNVEATAMYAESSRVRMSAESSRATIADSRAQIAIVALARFECPPNRSAARDQHAER